MTYQSMTTLSRIRAESPCEEGWRKLLGSLGKTAADDEPLPLLAVLDSNGLDDALWVSSYAMQDDRLARHFQAWCAEQVLHIFIADRPDDGRIAEQIAMLRNDTATDKERAASREAARAASREASREAAWDAAWDAAIEAAWAAAWEAAWAAAWEASREAAWDASREAQERQLRLMLAGAA